MTTHQQPIMFWINLMLYEMARSVMKPNQRLCACSSSPSLCNVYTPNALEEGSLICMICCIHYALLCSTTRLLDI